MIAAIFMLGAVVLYGWEKQQLDQPRNPSTNNQASVGYESHAKTVTLIRPPSATLAPGF
jgi:hypothetical protein